MNGQHKKNLTVSEKTLSSLYLKQGLFQQLLKKKVTLSDTVDYLILFHNERISQGEFKLEEKPQ